MARVFEPFFTTKEVGKGTGLGLSMVYGFVRQSGEHLRIESSLGRGTTVTLYLPRFTGVVIQEEAMPPVEAMPAHAGETILVVEDDPDVRAHTCEILGELGYDVIAVGDGLAALAIIDGDRPFSLIFTDIVLPGSLNGRDIALHARTARPATPILFTSGYARETIVQNERLEEGVELLSKPFTYAALASKVRTAIDRAVETA